MPRAARIVIPGGAHHVTQRGNGQQKLFFCDEDRNAYLRILAAALHRVQTRCLAWCLMDNHVHLMLVPQNADGLRAPMTATHTAYAQRINKREKLTGHLFQGRFSSYPMDDRHMMFAARYIENNPVAAAIVERAEDWPWSSARAHLEKRNDGLTDWHALGQHVDNWKAMLIDGLDAGAVIESAIRTGRPLGQIAGQTESVPL